MPPLLLTPQGESLVTLYEDAFELQQWVDGAIFNSADPRNLKGVSSAGAMLARLHQASRAYAGPVYRWPPDAHAGELLQGWPNFTRSKPEPKRVYALTAALSHLLAESQAVLRLRMMSIGSL